MSVATELTKLNTNIKNAYDEIATKGGTIPQNKNTDNLATAISSISGGGGADEYFYTDNTFSTGTNIVKRIPDITTTASSLQSYFSSFSRVLEIGNVNAPNATNINYLCEQNNYMKSIGTITTGNITTAKYAFSGCWDAFETAPQLNTQYCTDFMRMFANCWALKNVPIYDFSSATTLYDMFGSGVNSLTDQSLDNILQSCITATSYTGTKTLTELGLNTNYYSSRIQACPHYQDFLDAGWTIS